jgi:hypothetical protein
MKRTGILNRFADWHSPVRISRRRTPIMGPRMNTTLRRGDARASACEGDESLVALVGFRRRPGSNATGLFARCQLKILDLPTPEVAVRSFALIAPEAVIIDSHHPALKRLSEPVLNLLRAVPRHHHGRTRQTALIFLNSTGVSPELREAFLDAGAIVVQSGRQSYRQLIRLVRQLSGYANDCCTVGDLPKITLNADATDALHPRH